MEEIPLFQESRSLWHNCRACALGGGDGSPGVPYSTTQSRYSLPDGCNRSYGIFLKSLERMKDLIRRPRDSFASLPKPIKRLIWIFAFGYRR
jgi:hypothetical protein